MLSGTKHCKTETENLVTHLLELLSWSRRKSLPHDAGDDDKGLRACQEKLENNALTLLAKAKEPEKGREGTVWSFSCCYPVLLEEDVASALPCLPYSMCIFWLYPGRLPLLSKCCMKRRKTWSCLFP